MTHYATAIALGGCVAIALAGVLVFGDLTAGNILNNFPASDTMVNVARLYVSLSLTLPICSTFVVLSPFLLLMLT